jgi:two-component system sensor histidine kinase/response regulator
MDYNIPFIDGVTWAKRLSQKFHSSIAPFIFLTGHTEANRQLECSDAGASDFISKPVVADILRLRIQHQIKSILKSVNVS